MYLQDIYLYKNLILNSVQLVVQTQLAVTTVDCTHTRGTDVLLMYITAATQLLMCIEM